MSIQSILNHFLDRGYLAYSAYAFVAWALEPTDGCWHSSDHFYIMRVEDWKVTFLFFFLLLLSPLHKLASYCLALKTFVMRVMYNENLASFFQREWWYH